MASDSEVDIKFVSDDRDTIRSFLRQQKEILKNQRALAKMGSTAQRSFQKIERGSNQSTKSLLKFNTSMIGVGSIVGGILAVGRQINEEHKDFMRRNRESQVTSRSFGQQMRLTRIAFTEDETLKNKDLEKVTKQVSKKTQTDANFIGDAMTDAFSAKGALKNRDAVNAIEAAFSLLPNDLEAGKNLASRAMDVSNATGIKDMKAIVGFLQNIQNTARITTLPKVGQNLVPAINALQQSGDTPEQAAEVVVTLTKLMSDAKGELSKTASINLATRLADFVPDEKGKGKDKRGKFNIPQEQIQKYEAAGSTTERIAILQKSPELRREFIGNTPFAAESSEFIKALLKGDAAAQAQYKATQEGINPLDANQIKAFEKKLTDIRGGEFQGQVNAKERGDVNLQQFQLNDKMGQNIATAEGILNQALGQVGLTERQIKRTDFEWMRGESPAEYASQIVQDSITGLMGQRRKGGITPQADRDLFNRIEYLQSQKEILDKLAEEQTMGQGQVRQVESQLVDIRKLMFNALPKGNDRTRILQSFGAIQNPFDPAGTAIEQLQPELQAYRDLQARGKISEAQLGVLKRLEGAIAKLSELSKQNRGGRAEPAQPEARPVVQAAPEGKAPPAQAAAPGGKAGETKPAQFSVPPERFERKPVVPEVPQPVIPSPTRDRGEASSQDRPRSIVVETKSRDQSQETPRQQQQAQQSPPPPAPTADNKVLLAATKEQTGVMKDLLKEIVKLGGGQSQPQPQPRPQVRIPPRRPAWRSPSTALNRRD